MGVAKICPLLIFSIHFQAILLLALPSFVGASGNLIVDYQNYANALNVYFLIGGSLPMWDNFVSTTYGQTQALGCFVIVDLIHHLDLHSLALIRLA